VTFIMGMFFRRVAARAGFWGILVGTLSTIVMYVLYKTGALPFFRSDIHYSEWSGIVGFTAGALAILIASRGQAPKRDEELHGLVWGMAIQDVSDTARYPWYKSPVVMGITAIVLGLLLYILLAVL
jgi:SSS family solute:Na+ symporter